MIEETRQNDAYISRRIPVPLAFQEVFSHFYIAENRGAQAISLTLLPSYQMIMVFNFGTPVFIVTPDKEEVIINTCLVAGPVRQAFDYTLPPGAEILVANFKDDAFFRFFGVASMDRAFSAHPDALLHDNCFIELWTELRRMNSESRIGRILDFCKPYIRERSSIAGQIAGFSDDCLNPVKELSGKNNISERSVQLSHKKHFGFSAKEMARYSRFIKAIGMIQHLCSNSPKVDWFEVIHGCGYYDQSQLIHDFKHYLHLSPTQYLQFQQGICNPVI